METWKNAQDIYIDHRYIYPRGFFCLQVGEKVIDRCTSLPISEQCSFGPGHNGATLSQPSLLAFPAHVN